MKYFHFILILKVGFISDETVDPEESRFNVAMVNTEAFADLSSPMRPPVSFPKNKRKSNELETPNISNTQKRRSIFQTPAALGTTFKSNLDMDAEADFFQTQFLKQIDNLSKKSIQQQTVIGNTQISSAPLRMTQMLNDDFGFLDQVEDFSTTEISKPNRLSDINNLQNSDSSKTIVLSTQILTDDITFDDMPQCSQVFLHDVRQVEPVDPPSGFIEPVTVYTSIKNATSYIELQREMLEENIANLEDDNFLDAELSQAYRSTQYRRELEKVFDHCEKSICNNKSGDEMDDSSSHMVGLDNMDWTQSEFEAKTLDKKVPTVLPKTPMFSPTNYVRRRLEDFKNKSASPRINAVTPATSFQGLGPFFGLPLLVKSLIRDYKGISELYGKVILNTYLLKIINLLISLKNKNLIFSHISQTGKKNVSHFRPSADATISSTLCPPVAARL